MGDSEVLPPIRPGAPAWLPRTTDATRPVKGSGGRPDRFMREALIQALHREAEEKDPDTGKKRKKLAVIADKLCDLGVKGDVLAIREIFDRVEGKASQAISAEGDGIVLVLTGVPRERAT